MLVQFSKGIEKRKKLGIVEILQIPKSTSIGTYLGCMNIDRKRRRRDFMVIKENCKLASWKARTLSQVGKSVLIKSNAPSIPLITMQG